jgi:hypothetical protein
MQTSKQQIIDLALKHKWQLPPDTNKPILLLVSLRQKLMVKFDQHGRVIGAAVRRPLPFNAGISTIPLDNPKKDHVMRILRGEA